MAGWQIDTTRPQIVIHAMDGALSDAELDAYVLEGTAVFLRSGPHVTLIDTARMGSVSAYARARTLDWFKEHRARLIETCLGVGYVIPSPLFRFMAMTVFFAINPSIPYAVFETREQALAWAAARLAEAA
jgi:hypothetical protein